MQIIGHRGLIRTGTVENTLSAVRAALTAGVDGVEIDVRVTADGVAVCCHDADLRRVSGTDLSVEDSTYDVVRAVALPHGQVVPRLTSLAALVNARQARLVAHLHLPLAAVLAT